MGIVANREREAGDAVSFGAISKDTNRRPDQDMIEAVTDLRESGQVLSSWIADETRSLDNFVGSPTVREWMLEVLPVARLDPWAGKAPLILTERRSLAGVLQQHCQSVLCSGRADQWLVRGIPAHDDRFELTSFASGSVRRRP